MKFSENQNYLEYMDHYAHERYELARLAIYRCIEDLNIAPNSTQMSELLELTGKLFFLEGNVQEALVQYELSEQADPDSLLAKYFFAKFLGENLKDIHWANQKCDEIISIANSYPFPESEDDYGSSDYVRMASELKEKLTA
jgi:hypothetical protein